MPGQQPHHAPQVICRVFHLKLHALLDDLTKRDVLGKIKAHVYVIEFQKRGLPHAHILLILDDDHKITSVEDIDRCISAELPNPDTDPTLFRIVKQNMIHSCIPQRCGPIVNNKCKKRYPRAWVQETVWNEDGYPIYRRCNNGRTTEIGRRVVDNRSIVPYNPYLSKRYNAHINVEVCLLLNNTYMKVCCSVRAFKYLYKYVYKGSDCTTVALEFRNPQNGRNQPNQVGDGNQPQRGNAQRANRENNEILQYLDARYVGPCEAAWRLSGFEMHARKPTITRLQVRFGFVGEILIIDSSPGSASSCISRG